jgi:hypothetical protein
MMRINCAGAMRVDVSTRLPHSCAPKGLQQTSPGQRPGFAGPHFFSSPERANQGGGICAAPSGLACFFLTLTQGVALGSLFHNVSRALKGRNKWRHPWFALSGLDHFFTTVTQGVALGWFVDAPSGRQKTRP